MALNPSGNGFPQKPEERLRGNDKLKSGSDPEPDLKSDWVREVILLGTQTEPRQLDAVLNLLTYRTGAGSRAGCEILL